MEFITLYLTCTFYGGTCKLCYVEWWIAHLVKTFDKLMMVRFCMAKVEFIDLKKYKVSIAINHACLIC